MVSFVYFDVGGVVIDDFSGNDKWQQLKTELGVTSQNNAAFEKLWDTYSPELNTTRDAEALLMILKKELGLQLPSDYSLLDGFVKRFEANPLIWPIIKSAKRKVPIGLLTNMYPGMFAAIEQRSILPKIGWDVVVDSSIEALQKPDWKFFELAEKRASAKDQEILFIDNGAGHIKEATAFGWQTFLYDSANHEVACHDLAAFLQVQNLLD
jgi:FMN phosphatase YigB (HAD superfamily)